MSEIEALTNRINELENKLVELELKKSKNKSKEEEQHLEPAICEICHKTFKNKYILKTHINHIHNENRQRYECPYCQKKLSSKYYLEKHILNIHADEK